MKPSTKRIIFIILALVLLLASVFVYSAFIRKSYENISSLRSKLESENLALAKYREAFSKIQTLLEGIDNLPSVQNQVSYILPQERNSGYLVGQLVGLSRINGLSINSLSTKVNPIQPSKSSVIKSLGKLTAQIKVSGSYAGFKSLLRQIETNILILDVSDIKIEKPDTGGNVSYNLSVTSYYQTN